MKDLECCYCFVYAPHLFKLLATVPPLGPNRDPFYTPSSTSSLLSPHLLYICVFSPLSSPRPAFSSHLRYASNSLPHPSAVSLSLPLTLIPVPPDHSCLSLCLGATHTHTHTCMRVHNTHTHTHNFLTVPSATLLPSFLLSPTRSLSLLRPTISAETLCWLPSILS